MRTLKLTIEYDGTRYSGWQQQANARTIAGALIKAGDDFFGREIEVGGAGRTDAGVHALAQVAHVKFPRWGASSAAVRVRIEKLTPREIVYGFNDRLPSDINVLAVEDAPYEFHARHTAVARTYLYQISTRRTAFGKKYMWWVKDRLNVEAMADAAATFTGRHDFAAFSEHDAKREQSSVVVVQAAEIAEADHLITFRITASHFLWKMVRRLAGSIVEVGRGGVEAKEVMALLKDPRSKSRLDPARLTAPPAGLFLESITYPNPTTNIRPPRQWALQDRTSERSRNKKGSPA